MVNVTLMSTDGAVQWMSASPGPPPERIVGTKLWQWACPRERDRWRAHIADCVLDGKSGPHLATYDGRRYITSFTKVTDHLIVNTWREHFPAHITDRELSVLKLIVDDAKPQAIARQLNLSVHTIETYRTRLREKLGVAGTAGMTKWAVRVGLVTP
jgi:DNA-binding CsgD family transcriptional regulator